MNILNFKYLAPFLLLLFLYQLFLTGGFVFSSNFSFFDLASLSAKETGYKKASSSFQCGGLLFDIDANQYETVKIGDLCWMAENLRTTRYQDGTPVPNIIYHTAWSQTFSGARTYYANHREHAEVYGKLYNWFAVDHEAGLCPSGWRVPSDKEWKEMEIFLGIPPREANLIRRRGDLYNIGGKLKADDDAGYWRFPNEGANNESGFNGLPGGARPSDGSFDGIGMIAVFWSSSEDFKDIAWSRRLSYGNSGVFRAGYDKRFGFSVRCVKN